ncbi:formyltetrahydrofolate deformylase [Terrimonas sp.]|uniref:formyltetrahydrofolate deformylase n=1 Tax=Terrimonas sp. TaxID=1914338 RepID=UPI000D523063|nr:formyltetrahydrofolate deformylase [Terrimonas sp.]PVD50971.1 formyltetrahydrofolate deformylase [Terrimonas sp.]
MIILIQCRDRVGLVAGISGVLAELQLNITSMREYVAVSDDRFYMRVATATSTNEKRLETALKKVLPDNAEITIHINPDKKIIVLVTKEYHCLSDILIRNYFKTLNASVQCVIGNHNVLKDICNRFEVPFHYISHEDKSKEDFERLLSDQIRKYAFDYIVLAKFMRILSPAFVANFQGSIINIHHSFLPAFIGANPYRQAFERGVKVIGATAHFVTNDLDEGPIIVQQTINVNHTHTTADMVKAGKEIETLVLATALKLALEDRVFIYGNKTVVFE